MILVALAGVFLLIGWAGETFFGLPPQIALIFYLLAYGAGGYDVATHALPGLFRGKFDTDVLMLAAAVGAAIIGAWAEGAFLLFLFSLGHTGEHYALDRARNAVNALGQLMPQTARVRRDGQIAELPVAKVQVGEVVGFFPYAAVVAPSANKLYVSNWGVADRSFNASYTSSYSPTTGTGSPYLNFDNPRTDAARTSSISVLPLAGGPSSAISPARSMASTLWAARTPRRSPRWARCSTSPMPTRTRWH